MGSAPLLAPPWRKNLTQTTLLNKYTCKTGMSWIIVSFSNFSRSRSGGERAEPTPAHILLLLVTHVCTYVVSKFRRHKMDLHILKQ